MHLFKIFLHLYQNDFYKNIKKIFIYNYYWNIYSYYSIYYIYNILVTFCLIFKQWNKKELL